MRQGQGSVCSLGQSEAGVESVLKAEVVLSDHQSNLCFISKISYQVPPFHPGSVHFLERFLHPLAPSPPSSSQPLVPWGSRCSHSPAQGDGLQNKMNDLLNSKPSAAWSCNWRRGHRQAWCPARPGSWLASCNGIRAGHAHPACTLPPARPSLPPLCPD